MSTDREVLFRVTAADCDWQYVRASGKGGQNVNKRSTKVRCTHRASGAVGVAQDHREQRRNKVLAFERMAADPKFTAWHRTECARRLGQLKSIEEEVDRQMRPGNIRVEVQDQGRWRDAVPEDFVEF